MHASEYAGVVRLCNTLLRLRNERSTLADFSPSGLAIAKREGDACTMTSQGLAVQDLDFPLPHEAIATSPAEPRESAKLMVVDRATGSLRAHASVAQLAEFFAPRDLLILNTTRVLQARLEGIRADTGGRVEGLYLQPAMSDGSRKWICLLSAKRLKEGVVVTLHGREVDVESKRARISLRLISRVEAKSGAWLVEPLATDEDASLLALADEALLEVIGHTPLPPYIRSARKRAHEAEERASDRERYQTTFAGSSSNEGSQQLGAASEKVGLLHTGSVAAPTAGLHLTPRVLGELQSKGVHVEHVVLHVGLGTFAPVEVQYLHEHPMHEERCSMHARVRDAIKQTKQQGGRVICVGTTSVRTVESYAAMWESVQRESSTHDWPAHLDTKLLMAPGYTPKWTDGLLTNFHTPRSTLLALVSTMLGKAGKLPAGDEQSGLARLKELYAIALEKRYRFFSYGDAMLIL